MLCYATLVKARQAVTATCLFMFRTFRSLRCYWDMQCKRYRAGWERKKKEQSPILRQKHHGACNDIYKLCIV